MEFKCDKCGTRTLQPENADRLCQADHMIGMDPQENTICGGRLVPDPHPARAETEYMCDRCGHKSRGNKGDVTQSCWMPDPQNPLSPCSGTVYPVIRWRKAKHKAPVMPAEPASTLAELYPEYYKDVRHLDVIDVYQVHNLFPVDDPTGCLPHASKKILLCGVRTGNKPKRKDIREARDTLTRYLEITANGEEE